MQMKKNRTAQFMIQRLGTSKVWTQRKFIPNEHLANFCTICHCKLFFGFLIYQKPLNVHLLAPISMRPACAVFESKQNTQITLFTDQQIFFMYHVIIILN